MPLPAYILCSQSGSVDTESNRVSAFNLVEKIRIFRRKIKNFAELSPQQISSGLIRVVAAWFREDSDAHDRPHEVEILGHFPNLAQPVSFGSAQFAFVETVHRTIIQDLLLSQFWGPGTLRIEARIRRVGDESWLNSLTYPILLEEVPLPESVLDPSNPETTSP